ncbi:MAG: hypothetical protein CVU96_04205, partial [Firmicutes bacterium HGW-Firmicutes-20]
DRENRTSRKNYQQKLKIPSEFFLAHIALLVFYYHFNDGTLSYYGLLFPQINTTDSVTIYSSAPSEVITPFYF